MRNAARCHRQEEATTSHEKSPHQPGCPCVYRNPLCDRVVAKNANLFPVGSGPSVRFFEYIQGPFAHAERPAALGFYSCDRRTCLCVAVLMFCISLSPSREAGIARTAAGIRAARNAQIRKDEIYRSNRPKLLHISTWCLSPPPAPPKERSTGTSFGARNGPVLHEN